MSLDGLRAWIGEVERKLGVRTKVMLALAAIAIAGAGAAIYLAIDTRQNAVSKSDLEEIQTELGAGGAALGADSTEIASLQAEIAALRAQLDALEATKGGGGAGGKGGGTGGGIAPGADARPELPGSTP